MKKITSETVGILTQDNQFEDWWISDPISIPFLENKSMTITFVDFNPDDDVNFTTESDKALKLFLNKKSVDRLELSELAYENCMKFLSVVPYDKADEPLWKIKTKADIWNFIYPTDIYVSRRHRRDKDIYINIACECEWEQEHGLQFIFRRGEFLVRVSDQDGHLTEADAYDIDDSQDKLLIKSNNINEYSKAVAVSSRPIKNSNWWRRIWIKILKINN